MVYSAIITGLFIIKREATFLCNSTGRESFFQQQRGRITAETKERSNYSVYFFLFYCFFPQISVLCKTGLGVMADGSI